MAVNDKLKPDAPATSVPASSASPPPPQRRSGRWWAQKLTSAGLVFGVGIALIAALGVAQRIGWITGAGQAPADAGDVDAVYACPMHPQIRQPLPGNCPICGMRLVPATSGRDTGLDALAVTITPAARRLANIQTDSVRSEPVVTTIETLGAIAIDESRMATIASYIDGRIERLFADYTGVHVDKGDHLAVVYSPELYSAQVEYLESRKSLDRTAFRRLSKRSGRHSSSWLTIRDSDSSSWE